MKYYSEKSLILSYWIRIQAAKPNANPDPKHCALLYTIGFYSLIEAPLQIVSGSGEHFLRSDPRVCNESTPDPGGEVPGQEDRHRGALRRGRRSLCLPR